MNKSKLLPAGGLLGIALLITPFSQAAAQSAPPPIPPAVIEAITPAVARSVADAIGQTLASGAWARKAYKIHGHWKIVARGDKRYIVFDEDFKTRSGPDLKVYLSSRSLASLSDKTVASTSVEIAPLKAPRGAQEYEIPANLNLNEYRSLVIHCKKFAHLWGGGKITP